MSIKLERKIKIFIQKSLFNIFYFFYPNKKEIPPQKTLKSFSEVKNIQHQEIYLKTPLKRVLPKSIHESTDKAFIDLVNFELESDFVMQIPNGRAFGEDGLVVSEDNQIISETLILGGEKLEDHNIFKRYKLPKTIKVNNAALLTSKWRNCYYHWIIDVLPKLHLLEKAEIKPEKYILNDYKCTFQVETIALLGIEEDKIIRLDNESIIEVFNLIVPSLPGSIGNPPLWACEYLKNKLLIPNVDKFYPEKIYLSREKAPQRRIQNEDEIFELLKKYGFKKIIPEDLSMQEQFNHFANAKIIVSPHGAGLTNLVFSNDKIKVLEIFTPNYINVCFWALSNLKNIDYFYLKGENIPSENFDIFVNIEELEQTLKLMNL